MENKLFREKSLNRISSPDNLTEYIRVTTPGVWIVLTAIILLLAGVCCWGFFGRLDTKIDTIVIADGKSVYCIVEDSFADKIEPGNDVKIEGRTYRADRPESGASELTAEDSPYLLHLLGKTDSCWVVKIGLSDSYTNDEGEMMNDILADGAYAGYIVTDSVKPMTFVTN